MGIFSDVKDHITARQAVEFYGIKVNRNGMTKCLFHNDKNPSMKLDRRFHCFGCGADGDVIDLTAHLFGLSNLDVAKKLIQDFGLPIDTGYRDLSAVSPQRSAYLERMEEERKFKKWIADNTSDLLEYEKILKDWLKTKAPKTPDEDWNDQFVEAGKNLPYVGYLRDQLLLEDEETKREYYEIGREEVERYAKRARELRTAEESKLERVGCRADDGSKEKGTIKQTITNIVTVLSYDPKLKDAIRNNEQTERKDIVKPMWWKRETSSMTDTDEAYITMYLEKTYGFCNEQKITKAIKIVANNNRYHPIQDKLNSLYSY